MADSEQSPAKQEFIRARKRWQARAFGTWKAGNLPRQYEDAFATSPHGL